MIKHLTLALAVFAVLSGASARKLKQDLSAVVETSVTTGESKIVGMVEERVITSPSAVQGVLNAVQNLLDSITVETRVWYSGPEYEEDAITEYEEEYFVEEEDEKVLKRASSSIFEREADGDDTDREEDEEADEDATDRDDDDEEDEEMEDFMAALMKEEKRPATKAVLPGATRKYYPEEKKSKSKLVIA